MCRTRAVEASCSYPSGTVNVPDARKGLFINRTLGARDVIVDETEELESELSNVISMDYGVYVLADDEHQHYVPLDAIAAYASYLFFLFVGAAAERLRKRLEKDVKKAGVVAADKLIDLARSVVGLRPSRMPAQRRRSEIEQTRAAAKALKGAWDEETVAAGEEAVRKRLVEDHFPEALAKQKASDIRRIIRRRALQ
jgi:hypothetical protein